MNDASTAAPEPSRCRIQCRERRASVRHASTMEAACHPIAVPAVGPSCPARIGDISRDGLSLIVPHPYEPGALLSVVPEVLPQSLAPALEVRVLHVEPHGEGLWRAGCALLTPLSEEELQTLLS